MKKTIYPLPGGKQLAHSGSFSGPVAFSNAVRVSGGTMVFVSGQLAFDQDMQLVGKDDMRAQTRQVLANLGNALSQSGASFQDVVRVQVFVTDLTEFRAIHEVRLEYFAPDYLPASTLVQVTGLVHPDALIEMDAVAMI